MKTPSNWEIFAHLVGLLLCLGKHKHQDQHLHYSLSRARGWLEIWIWYVIISNFYHRNKICLVAFIWQPKKNPVVSTLRSTSLIHPPLPLSTPVIIRPIRLQSGSPRTPSQSPQARQKLRCWQRGDVVFVVGPTTLEFHRRDDHPSHDDPSRARCQCLARQQRHLDQVGWFEVGAFLMRFW